MGDGRSPDNLRRKHADIVRQRDNNIVPTPDEPVVLNCAKPDYLKAGDKVALISPSYFTPMENVEKTADVLRSWGLEPVVGPNVGKVVDGKYAAPWPSV